MSDDWCRVTKDRFPLLHGVLEDVSHDAGGGAGHTVYVLPPRWLHELPVVELALTTLTEEELSDFATGEESVQEEIAEKSRELRRAQSLFLDFFDNCGGENDDVHRKAGTYRG